MHVYLMDMNELYQVAVRLHGWEFMAEASHINAQKAVRGLASDLQEFHAQAQDNSAAQLMQQGAAPAAMQVTGELAEIQLEERRLELKRKADDWELTLQERRFTLEMQMKEWQAFFPCVMEKKKLDNTGEWISFMDTVDPDWRQNKQIQGQAKDRLVSALFEPPLAIEGGPERASLTIKKVAAASRGRLPARSTTRCCSVREKNWRKCTARNTANRRPSAQSSSVESPRKSTCTPRPGARRWRRPSCTR
jgi:hypothetical protein